MTAVERVVVFGATGGTGRQLVRQALDAGLRVRALARRPEALDVRHDNLQVVEGDVLAPEDVARVVAPGDRVVSALGIGHSTASTTVYSRGTANVLSAMACADVQRLVCLSTCGIDADAVAAPVQRFVTRTVLQRVLRRPYADMAEMESLVRGTGVDWTVVRAARLTDGRRTGRYRVGTAGTLRGSWSISRADLAEYLLRSLDDPDPVRRTVEIAY